MIIAKKWLESHFQKKIPEAEEIANLFLLHSFEIEGIEKKEKDTLIDIDVLPNRAHDALSHRGLARELAGLIDVPLKEDRYTKVDFPSYREESFYVRDESKGRARRYLATLLKNISVQQSPAWLRERLETIGQKSINNVVDATNYILFDLGQPLHVFDADKVRGGITVRFAREGESMVTLSGEQLQLTPEDLVIADEEGVLALAGVKGGTKAELSESTNNIVIEAANFDPVTVRKSARRHKILTDASKRYENGITSELAFEAKDAILSLLAEFAETPDTLIGTNEQGFPFFEFYPDPEEKRIVSLRLSSLKKILGFSIPQKEVGDILRRLHFRFVEREEETYDVIIPFERLDIQQEEDLIEEIGRLYGYHNIPTQSLEHISSERDYTRTSFPIEQALKNFFIERGFDELMHYTFVKKGEVRVLNPVASHRGYLRKELQSAMETSLEENAKYADFLNKKRLQFFEVDTVHEREGEEKRLVFGIRNMSKTEKKKYGTEQEQIEQIQNALRDFCENTNMQYAQQGNTSSFRILDCHKSLSAEEIEKLFRHKSYGQTAQFQDISIYPYMKRDISFWAPEGRDELFFVEAIQKLPIEHLVRVYLTDTFTKDGRTSYTFSLFFQSPEKTLTDEEVNKEADKVYAFLAQEGAEVR